IHIPNTVVKPAEPMILRQRESRSLPAFSLEPPSESSGVLFLPRHTKWTEFLSNRILRCMKRIPAAKFKEQCLSILARVAPEGIIITKHGKPVAVLHPIKAASAGLIGSMKGKIKVKGNILSTGLDWDAQS